MDAGCAWRGAPDCFGRSRRPGRRIRRRQQPVVAPMCTWASPGRCCSTAATGRLILSTQPGLRRRRRRPARRDGDLRHRRGAEETLRRDPDGRVVYRFDHLLPGHFYHLDTTLYECDGAQRQESIRVDGNLMVGPINLGDGQPHRFSPPGPGPLRQPHHQRQRRGPRHQRRDRQPGRSTRRRLSLRRRRRLQRPGLLAGRGYGWLDGVANVSWGRLPYQSVRVDQTDNTVRYQFDRLAAGATRST